MGRLQGESFHELLLRKSCGHLHPRKSARELCVCDSERSDMRTPARLRSCPSAVNDDRSSVASFLISARSFVGATNVLLLVFVERSFSMPMTEIERKYTP